MSFYDSWSALMVGTIAGFILVFTALIAARIFGPFASERGLGHGRGETGNTFLERRRKGDTLQYLLV